MDFRLIKYLVPVLASVASLFVTPLVAAPTTGLIDGEQGLYLGEPQLFGNDISSTWCYPIVGNRSRIVAWIEDLHQYDSKTLVRRCFKDYSESKYMQGHGSAATVWEILNYDNSNLSPHFTVVAIPDLGMLSNPKYCGSKVAYWVSEKSRWFIQIYDLHTQQILGRGFVRRDAAATDFVGYFERPTWDTSCTKVSADGASIFLSGDE